MLARLRRLRSDFEQVNALFAEHPFVRIVGTEGEPPEKYTFEIRVRGLVVQEDEDQHHEGHQYAGQRPIALIAFAELFGGQAHGARPINFSAASAVKRANR